MTRNYLWIIATDSEDDPNQRGIVETFYVKGPDIQTALAVAQREVTAAIMLGRISDSTKIVIVNRGREDRS
jgi:hypothetical protein